MAVIETKNTTIYLPSFGSNYTDKISVILFFPTDNINKPTYVSMLTSSITEWFNKYVIVIVNDYKNYTFPKDSSDYWKSLQSEISKEMNINNLNIKDISLSFFVNSTSDSSLIQSNLGDLIPLGENFTFLNLMLIDPYPEGKIIDNIKKLGKLGTKTYLIYNTINWDSKFSLKFTNLSSVVSSFTTNPTPINTKNSSNDRDKIIGKFFTKWKQLIESTLTTPTLKPDPITENKGNKDFNENKTPEKTPETSSDPEIPKDKSSGGKLKMSFIGIDNFSNNVFSLNSSIEFQILIDQAVTENTDDFDDDGQDEYSEAGFEGLEEAGIILTPQEKDLQLQIANSQEEDNTSIPSEDPGKPFKIEPVGSFDALLRLAGQCARNLGKNPRVKYENLKRGYINGIHGLCPQGTACVLYAMSGVKTIQTPGIPSANWFSFGKQVGNSTVGGEAKFPSKYYKDKIKVGKEYFNDSSKWQIGDVIVVAYTGGKKHGHIQCWTGFKWMSDFTQNRIQVSHVDWNSVALWRLNEYGVKVFSKQMGNMK